jgi:hypothetical protein
VKTSALRPSMIVCSKAKAKAKGQRRLEKDRKVFPQRAAVEN